MIGRRARRAQLQLAFESLSIEGGLLSPDWLSKIARQEAAGQSDADYRVPKGLILRDEIGRYWRIAQALWAEFNAARPKSDSDVALSEKFTSSLLRDVFGFEDIHQRSAEFEDGDRRLPRLYGGAGPVAISDDGSRPLPLYYGVGSRVPIAIATAVEGLNAATLRFGDGPRRRSAFGIVQEQLNDTQHQGLWGIASDGLRLRLIRENPSLTRPAWVDVDLERLFNEERYSDFVITWLLFHESRFGKRDAPPDESWLESWRLSGREEGVRARDQLRDGVEAALVALGQGFMAHRDNAALRTSLGEGTLTVQGYFAELLRIVYRLIFLITAEERDLLHPPDCDPAARRLYDEGYSLRMLRERATRRIARDHFSDAWEGLKIVFRGTARGEPRLALPALGGLFTDEQCFNLAGGRIENRAIFDALFRLGWLRDATGLVRVNWRDMGPEEFGSIYESLLELAPQLSITDRRFSFASGSQSKGSARRLTSSYYTHDSLVQTLLDATVEPLIKRTIAEHPNDAATALLALSIVDPACGSGHFLLGAARRLGSQIASLRVNGTPSLIDYREALRDVMASCIYGVDRNPMAVELCKTALWIESVVPGRPLSFLDSHIRCGDALLGILDLALLDGGIPAEAYEARDGDEKMTAAAIRNKNKKRLKPMSALPLFAAAAASIHAVDLLPEETLDQVEAKSAALVAAETAPSLVAARLRADLFCAAFFARKTGATQSSVPVTADLDNVAMNQPPSHEVVACATEMSRVHNFFHWSLAFPDVFAEGGFDAVIGNPPWKKLRPDVNEWFAKYDPDVGTVAPAEQKKLLQDLLSIPEIAAGWEQYRQDLYDSAAFLKYSGRFTLFARGNLGKGEFDIYRMFVEFALAGTKDNGFTGQFVPENLQIGTNAAALRQALLSRFRLRLLLQFDNKRNIWFRGVHQEKRFCLYAAEKGGCSESFAAAFGVDSAEKLELIRSGKTLDYPVSLIREFSPDALIISTIAHSADLSIDQKLHASLGAFGETQFGEPEPRFLRELDMGNNRNLFKSGSEGLPLYQGSMIDIYDYRAQAYVSGRGKSAKWRRLPFGSTGKGVYPQWRVHESSIPGRVGDRFRLFRIGIADEANPKNTRTFVAALLPRMAICGDKVPTILFAPDDPPLMMLWLAVSNSFCSDYVARKRVSMKMSKTILYTLPLPRAYGGTALEMELAKRALVLSAVGSEMAAFWRDVAPLLNVDPRSKPLEDPNERDRVRAEIDVLVARDFFGLTLEEMRYMLDPADILGSDCDFETFGALKRAEIKQYHEFRSRRLILEAWASLPSPKEPTSEAVHAS